MCSITTTFNIPTTTTTILTSLNHQNRYYPHPHNYHSQHQHHHRHHDHSPTHQKSLGVPSQVKGRSVAPVTSTHSHVDSSETKELRKLAVRMRKTVVAPNRLSTSSTRVTDLNTKGSEESAVPYLPTLYEYYSLMKPEYQSAGQSGVSGLTEVTLRPPHTLRISFRQPGR